MAGDTSGTARKLDETPTWAVAFVCTTIIITSLLLEMILHKLGTWFTQKQKKALLEALEKIKAELMILGFISLILTFTQYYIAEICIPDNVADKMLPCPAKHKDRKEYPKRLLSFERRSLAAESKSTCKKGPVPWITTDGMHQLHILIFFLAVIHVVYSAVTMALGNLKLQWISRDSSFEMGTSDVYSLFVAGRFGSTILHLMIMCLALILPDSDFAHETSFVRAHSSFWTRLRFFFVIGCFFRQFYSSVMRSDYLTLRNGFISVHLAPGSKFDFHKYVKRSLEDDLKVVVGVSPLLWASFVVFLLININGTRALFWASLIPLVIILAVGTKLQAILTKMALEIKEMHSVVQGMPLVQGSDNYFWFGRPQFVHLIHFALFQNAFQLTYLLWITYEYGIDSCFHDSVPLLTIKILIGLGVLFLCSYSTLPLYALVSQMGSHMKRSIFDEQTSRALVKWHKDAKKKHGELRGRSPNRTPGDPNHVSSMASPSMSSGLHSTTAALHRYETAGHSTELPPYDKHGGISLHRYKTTGHSTELPPYDKHGGISHMEADPVHSNESDTARLIVRVDHGDTDVETIVLQPGEESRNPDDFSFVKAAPLHEN